MQEPKIKPIPDATPNSAQLLEDGFFECVNALFDAARVLQKNAPHARNYPSAESHKQADAEMARRIRVLCEMADQFTYEADAIGT